MRASSVVAAHFLTMDFTALTSEGTLWSHGFQLEDRSRHETIKIFSLIELEEGTEYKTPHGHSLVRVSRTEALLAGSISLTVDLADAAVSMSSPRNSFSDIPCALEEQSAVIGTALHHVRNLGAEPGPASLTELLRALRALPPADDGWLDSFLALDGMQALLDVLSLSVGR